MVIFLVGFMGSGKSSLGRRLATALDYDFLDSDQEIEKQVGRTIPEIFEDLGEESFRMIEENWLEDLNCENTVVALGGGTFCSEKNIHRIHEIGISVYLVMTVGMLGQRLVNATKARPLIESLKEDPKLLQAKIQEMLIERQQFYMQANIKFDGSNVNSERLDTLIESIQSSSSLE